MQMLGTVIVTVLLLGSLMLPPIRADPCDKVPVNTGVCDPSTNGASFYICTYGGPVLKDCLPGLVFSNQLQVCDWPWRTKCIASTDTSTEPSTSATASSSTVVPSSTTSSTSPTTTSSSSSSSSPSASVSPSTTVLSTKQDVSSSSSSTTTTHATATTTMTSKGRDQACIGVSESTSVCDPMTAGTTFIRCGPPDVYHVFSCPPGLLFNPRFQYCDYPHNILEKCIVGGGNGNPNTPPSTTVGSTTTTTTASYPTGTCNPATCTLPDCRCLGTDIPGNFTPSDVPQMVLLTFDDAITPFNFKYYERLLQQNALENHNYSAVATFFVSGDGNNDFQLAKTLHQLGNEMASHSLTHLSPSTWNANRWREEMQGMRQKLANVLGIPVDEIRGMRTPFLQLGGEVQFTMMQNNHFTYDTSMFGGSLQPTTDLPVWPFTLHYPPPPSVCDQANCPKKSYPGVWEVPLIRQYTVKDGTPCSMTDSCPLPVGASAADVKAFLRHNFDRHYNSNRAPFMISLHATWFSRNANTLQGLEDFLQEVRADPSVRQVTITQMLDWVRHPVPLDRLHELPSWAPRF